MTMKQNLDMITEDDGMTYARHYTCDLRLIFETGNELVLTMAD